MTDFSLNIRPIIAAFYYGSTGTSLSNTQSIEGFLMWAAVDALRTLFLRRGVDLLGHFGGAVAGFACAAAYQHVR